MDRTSTKQRVVLKMRFKKPVNIRYAVAMAEGVMQAYVSGDTPLSAIQASSYSKTLAGEKVRLHFTEEDCLDIVDRLLEEGLSARNVSNAIHGLLKEKRWDAMDMSEWLADFQEGKPLVEGSIRKWVERMRQRLKDIMQEAGV